MCVRGDEEKEINEEGPLNDLKFELFMFYRVRLIQCRRIKGAYFGGL